MCACGQRGCLETLASGSALARLWPQGSVNGRAPRAGELFAAAEAGDSAARRAAERIARIEDRIARREERAARSPQSVNRYMVEQMESARRRAESMRARYGIERNPENAAIKQQTKELSASLKSIDDRLAKLGVA